MTKSFTYGLVLLLASLFFQVQPVSGNQCQIEKSNSSYNIFLPIMEVDMAAPSAFEVIESQARQGADFPFDGWVLQVFPETVTVKLISSEQVKRNVLIPDHIKGKVSQGDAVKLGEHLGQPILVAIFPQLAGEINYSGKGNLIPNTPHISVVAAREGWRITWGGVAGADRYRVFRNDTPDESSPDEVGYVVNTFIVVPYESPYRYFSVAAISGLTQGQAGGWITDNTPPPVPTTFDAEDDIQGHRLLISSLDPSLSDASFKCWEVQQADDDSGTNAVDLGQMGLSDFPRLIQHSQGTTRYYRARSIDFADNASAWTSWQLAYATVSGNGETIQDKFDTYGGVLSSSIESLYWLELATFETGETWTAVSGLTVTQTTPINEGNVSLNLDCNAYSICRASLAKSLNLSTENRFTNDDYVSLALDISDNFGSSGNFYLAFANDSAMTNNYSYRIASPTAGRYYLKIKKSSFVASGSPNWATISHIFIYISNIETNHTTVAIDDLRIVKADPDNPNTLNDTGRGWDFAASTGSDLGEWHVYRGNRISEPPKPFSFGQVKTTVYPSTPSVYYLAYKPGANIVTGTVQVGMQLKTNGIGGFAFFVKGTTVGNWNMYGVIVDSSLNMLRLVKWVNGTVSGITSLGFNFDTDRLLWIGVDFREYESDSGRLKVFASFNEGNLIQSSNMVISTRDTQWLGNSGGSVGLLSYQTNARFINFVAGSPAHADTTDVAYSLDGTIIAGATRRVRVNRDNCNFEYSDDGSTWKYFGGLVGELKMWATNTAPAGWLLCYGQAISRTTYASLFGVIGTTFGTGDGSTTFNLPDLRGRMPLGQDDMGESSANRVTAAAADSIGGNGGAETVTLTISELPPHGHQFRYRTSGGTPGSPYYPGYVNGYTTTDSFSLAGDAVGNTGGGGAHNNMPPYLALNFIIYTGV